MGKLSDFVINLDSTRQVFYPGELLTGQVVMTLKAPLKMRSIRIHLGGRAYCHWVETLSGGDSTNSYEFSGLQQLVNKTVFLFGNKKEDRMHPPGRHRYPFSIRLPTVLPSSFEGSLGYIRYYLKGMYFACLFARILLFKIMTQATTESHKCYRMLRRGLFVDVTFSVRTCLLLTEKGFYSQLIAKGSIVNFLFRKKDERCKPNHGTGLSLQCQQHHVYKC